MKAGVDTGAVSSGVVGLSRWTFDVMGEPVDTVQLVQAASSPEYVTTK